MKILAAIDQSEYAIPVLEKAMRIAAFENAEVTALTVSSAPSSNLYLGEIPGEYMDKMREGVQKTVTRAQEQAKAAHRAVEIVVEEGPSPAGAIVRFAEKNGFDLIVIGNKGASAVERFLIGSVSSQVVANAHCSVMVLKK